MRDPGRPARARVITRARTQKSSVEEQQRVGRTKSKALLKHAGTLGVTRTLERSARLRQIALDLLVNFLVDVLDAFEGLFGLDKSLGLGKFCTSLEKIAGLFESFGFRDQGLGFSLHFLLVVLLRGRLGEMSSSN